MIGRARQTGFTLVEVMVASSLLALILFGMVASLRNLGQTASVLEARALASDDVRLVGSLLQRALSTASPRSHVVIGGSEPHIWFLGDQQALSWLGMLPARHGAGGLTHLRLSVGEFEGRRQLRLQMQSYAGDDAPPDWNQLEARVLLEELDEVRLWYRPFGEPDWLGVWDDPAVLPQFVQISVTVRGSAWPPLVFGLDNAEPRTGSGVQPRFSGRRPRLGWQ